MTERAKRRAAKQRKQVRRQPTEASEPATRLERLIVEAIDELTDVVLSSEDAEQGTAQATDRVRLAVETICHLAEPYDVFDVLESIRQVNMTGSPEAYSEAEHEGSAAVIELVAVVLAARGHRHAPGGAVTPRPRADGIIGEVNSLATQAMTSGGIRNALRLLSEPDRLDRIGLGTVLREMSLRNAAYPDMLAESLHALFDEPAVEQHCVDVLGCTVSDILNVFSGLETMHNAAWRARFDALAQYLEGGRMLERKPGSLTPAEKEEGRDLVMGLWQDPADCSVHLIADVATETGVPSAVVAIVYDLFSTYMQEADPVEAALNFLSGDSPLRVRPLLRDPSGDVVLVHSALSLPAVRERVEEALKTSDPAWATYSSHRGHLVENQALGYLAAMLPSADVRGGFQYFFPREDGPTAEPAPASYTRVGETDGLVLVDDIAIILESKAVALRSASRTGDPLRLRQDLRRIVGDAGSQAQRLRALIERDSGLRLRDDSWLDLAGVREIHSVAVSLDDLSGVATVTTELVSAGLLTSTHLPWTVSVHDLRIISELVARPAELILYLRRRTEPDVTRKFHAVDELDLFLECYATGLFVEPDPDAVHAELPQFGEPTTAARRRFRDQRVQLVASRTGPLDAWYLHEQGVRKTASAKPAANTLPAILEQVDALAAAAEPGWLSVGATLLEASSKLQQTFARIGPKLLAMTARDGLGHDASFFIGTKKDSSWLLTWMSPGPGESMKTSMARLRKYSSAKKHQYGVARAAGFLTDPDTGAIAAAVYDNRVPGEDAALDAAGVGLRPVGRVLRSLPPPST